MPSCTACGCTRTMICLWIFTERSDWVNYLCHPERSCSVRSRTEQRSRGPALSEPTEGRESNGDLLTGAGLFAGSSAAARESRFLHAPLDWSSQSNALVGMTKRMKAYLNRRYR